jgi:hypothetical protein
MTVHRRDVLRYLGLSAAWRLVRDLPASSATRLIIPFTKHGKSGRVAVTYGVTTDPVVEGFDVVAGMQSAMGACKGYPNVEAVIESYEGSGYRELCGWVQIISSVFFKSADHTETPDKTEQSIDKLPCLDDVDMPFAWVGILSRHFDAPCRGLGGFAQMRWTADTFLTTVPIRAKDEEIHRLAGFRWGFVLNEDRERHPTAPLPLTTTGVEAWNDLVPFLTKEFPNWRFAAG